MAETPDKQWDQAWVWENYLPDGWRVTFRLLANGFCHTSNFIYATKMGAIEAALEDAKEIVDFAAGFPPTGTPPPARDQAAFDRVQETSAASRENDRLLSEGFEPDVAIPEPVNTLYPDLDK